MKIAMLVVMSLLMLACGKKKEASPIGPGPTTNTTFNSYVNNFKANMVAAGLSHSTANLSVTFSDTLSNGVLGTCAMGTGVVKISRSWWDLLSPASREELINHELGHCVLNRLHLNTEVNSVPVSLMHQYHLGPTVYNASASAYRGYIAELFNSNVSNYAGLSFNAGNYASEWASSLENMEENNDYSHSQEDDSHIHDCYYYPEQE